LENQRRRRKEGGGGGEERAAATEFPTAIKLLKILINHSGGEVTPYET
jgi:hypothetical protein